MDDKLSLRTKLAYACGDAGCCFITYISINYYTFYMTNMIGLSLVVASIIVVISRIWDAINDIFVGVMVDRTYTPKGKARPWIKWFLIPLVVISILMFAVPNSLPNSAKAAWCGIAFCIFTLFYTTVNLPYGAMLPLMTKSGSQRTQLATFRMFGAMVGVIGIQIFFLPTVAIIADKFFGGERVYAYSVSAVIYTLLGGIILYMLYLGCPEKVYEEQLKLDLQAGITLEDRKRMAKEAKNNPLKDVSYLFRNKPWVIVFCIMFLSFLAQPLSTVGLPYFYVYYLHQDETGVALFSTVTMVTMLAGVFLTPFLIKKFDYKLPCIVGTAVSVACGVVAYFLDTNMMAVMVVMAIANFCAAPVGVAGLAMLADAIEYGDLKFDRRLEGLGTAAYSFSTKAGPAIGNIVISAILATAGLNTTLTISDQQPEAALSALHFALFLLPAILRVVQIILLFVYPLTRDKYEKVLEDIRIRNEARSEVVTGDGKDA